MEARTASKASMGPMIVGVIGGILLAIGSFLTWASVSLDSGAFVNQLASALGVDPSVVQGQLPVTNFSKTVSGFDGNDGKYTLVAGIIVVILAVVVFLKADLRKAMGAGLIVVGAIGAGIALYDISKVNDAKQAAMDAFSSALAGSGIDTSSFGNIFKVSTGIGIWTCALGGIIAVVAGIMALMAKAAAPAAAGAMGATEGFSRTSPVGSGFESSTPPPAPAASVSEPPAAPMSEPPAAPTSDPPAATMPEPSTPETPAAPEPPAAPSSGDAGDGGDASSS